MSSDQAIVAVTMADSLRRRIGDHAAQAYPHECCGFLLGTVQADHQRVVLGVEPVPNQVTDVADRYRISPSDYLRVDRTARARGWDVLGCYHSHPDAPAVPSAIDLADAWPWYIYLIVGLDAGDAVEWRSWMLDESDDGPGRFVNVGLEVR